MLRLAISADDCAAVEKHMKSVEPDEGAAFLLVRAQRTASGLRLVASHPRFPEAEDLDFSGPAILKPSTQLISKMVSWALEQESGLLFVHSHPNPRFPAGFSQIDREALVELGNVMPDLIDGPFVAAVVSPTGWAGEMLSSSRGWEPIERITAAGRVLRILSPLETREGDAELDDRQRRALGDINHRVRSIDVSLVGAGGLGSPFAETVTRMGVRRLQIFDFDLLDTESNLRRIFGARRSDLAARRPKAEVIAQHCANLNLGTTAVGLVADVRKSLTLPDLLDADVIACGTDSHSSRAVLNAISYAFCIPLIDCGVIPGLRTDGGLESLGGELRIVGPGLPCLHCRDVLNPDEIRLENLPADERRAIEREGYGTGTPEVIPSACALTVVGAGHMASAIVGLLDVNGEHRASAWKFDALNGFSEWEEVERGARCLCRAWEASGRALSLGLR